MDYWSFSFIPSFSLRSHIYYKWKHLESHEVNPLFLALFRSPARQVRPLTYNTTRIIQSALNLFFIWRHDMHHWIPPSIHHGPINRAGNITLFFSKWTNSFEFSLSASHHMFLSPNKMNHLYNRICMRCRGLWLHIWANQYIPTSFCSKPSSNRMLGIVFHGVQSADLKFVETPFYSRSVIGP